MIDLAQYEELLVCQQVEHIEAFIGFEMANQYSVFTPDGYEMLHAFEESGTVSRQFMGSHRPLDIHVVDNQRDTVMTASAALSFGSARTSRSWTGTETPSGCSTGNSEFCAENSPWQMPTTAK